MVIPAILLLHPNKSNPPPPSISQGSQSRHPRSQLTSHARDQDSSYVQVLNVKTCCEINSTGIVCHGMSCYG